MLGSLKFVNRGDDGVERASRCFPFVRFAIDAKKISVPEARTITQPMLPR